MYLDGSSMGYRCPSCIQVNDKISHYLSDFPFFDSCRLKKYFLIWQYEYVTLCEWNVQLNHDRFCTITVISLKMRTTIPQRPEKKKKKLKLRGIVIGRLGFSKCSTKFNADRSFKKFLLYFHNNLMWKINTVRGGEAHWQNWN